MEDNGGIMLQNDKASSEAAPESGPLPVPDYSPRSYSAGELLRMGLRLAAAAGVFFLIIWLCER
jgi:hypothetical protein